MISLGYLTAGLPGALLATVAMKVGFGIDMTGNPLLLFSVLLEVGGVQFLSTGLLGELLMRTYFESQGKTSYTVRETRNLGETEKPERRRKAG